MTEASKEADFKVQEWSKIQHVLCIYYSAQFDEFLVKLLIDLSSYVNVMQSSFARKQDFCICKTNIFTQKIDIGRPKIYRIVIALFQINDWDKKFRFFKETFLLANISIDIAFRILFLILSNIKLNFNNQKLK